MAALCRRHGAWQVKSMGDGAMIWAPDASAAATLARAGAGRGGRGPICCRFASVPRRDRP